MKLFLAIFLIMPGCVTLPDKVPYFEVPLWSTRF